VAALEGNEGFSRFIAEAGPGWSVQWNTVTGTPHLASGKALAIAGAEGLTRENIERHALLFVSFNAQRQGGAGPASVGQRRESRLLLVCRFPASA